jgi:hypothetical protein
MVIKTITVASHTSNCNSGILEQYFMFHTFAHSKGNEMQEPCVPMDSFSLKISIIYLMQDCSRPMPAKWLCTSNSSNFG